MNRPGRDPCRASALIPRSGQRPRRAWFLADAPSAASILGVHNLGGVKMDAAVAALLGAALGSIVPAVTSLIQAASQARRERMKVAADLGLADWKARVDYTRSSGGAGVPPLSVFVSYHSDVLDAMHAGPIDAAALTRLAGKWEDVMKAGKAPATPHAMG